MLVCCIGILYIPHKKATHPLQYSCDSKLNYYRVFSKTLHPTFPLVFLLHPTQGMKGCLLIRTHLIFCLLVTQLPALGFIYGALFSPHCGDKINLFLMASASPHTPTASKCFEVLTNLFMQCHWKCCITLTLQKCCCCTGGCSFLGRLIPHIQSANSTISV